MLFNTKKLKYITILCLFLLKNVYAMEYFLKDTKYLIDFCDTTLDKQFYSNTIDTGLFFYFLSEEGKQIRNYSNKEYPITVRNQNCSLTYDIGKILFDNNYSNCRIPQIAFFSSDDYVDLLYYDSLFDAAHKIKIIRYDFKENKIHEFDNYKVSHLFYNIFSQNEKTSFAKQIYERIVNNKIVKDDIFVCYTGDEPLSYSRMNDNLFTQFDGKIILQDPYNINSRELKYFNKRKENPILSQKINLDTILSAYERSLFIDKVNYYSDSYLIEGQKEYKPENLKDFTNTPFVPKSPYDTEIIVQCDKEIGGLLIFNGFYHQEKPYLFTENNRAKKIEIQYKNSYNLIHQVILEDTQREQFIPLLNINENVIKIKILSVYKGTKYNDTCINCIIPIGVATETSFFNSRK